MNQHNTKAQTPPDLLTTLTSLLQAHRPAFRQARCYQRGMALVLAELFAFARHTLTQGLLALGVEGADWSAWYRLFSRPRFDVGRLTQQFFHETLAHSPVNAPYVTGMDGTQIPRSSLTMPGTGWLRAPRTAVFRRGLHRAQRFLQGAWLPPREHGYSRAIPLCFLPAFPPKARPADAPACKEWEAGLRFMRWVRQSLDAADRQAQWLLTLADGAFDTLALWRGLPERTILLVRTAKNRHLRELPGPYAGRGPHRKYGPAAPSPSEWLQQRRGWTRATLRVRGRALPLQYRVEGPYLRETAPQVPLFLIVTRGARWTAGKTKVRRARREPAFYLVTARREAEQWCLPLPAEELLAWMWQRWELEVAHREMKSGFGVGQKQCWNARAAVVSVQWSVWVYAVLLLAGYRTWGLCGGPARRERWWPGGARWSFNTLWRSYRAALWGTPDFRALWTPTGDNWPKKEALIAHLTRAAFAAARA